MSEETASGARLSGVVLCTENLDDLCVDESFPWGVVATLQVPGIAEPLSVYLVLLVMMTGEKPRYEPVILHMDGKACSRGAFFPVTNPPLERRVLAIVPGIVALMFDWEIAEIQRAFIGAVDEAFSSSGMPTDSQLESPEGRVAITYDNSEDEEEDSNEDWKKADGGVAVSDSEEDDTFLPLVPELDEVVVGNFDEMIRFIHDKRPKFLSQWSTTSLPQYLTGFLVSPDTGPILVPFDWN